MDFQDLITSVASVLSALAEFPSVNTHEPQSVPSDSITCAVWAQEIEPDPQASGLPTTSARITLAVRLYSSMNQQPYDQIDPAVMNATSAVFAAFSGDFTLGGTVRNVDLMGMKAQAGYVQQDGQTLRVMTITVPIVVNDLWEQVAA